MNARRLAVVFPVVARAFCGLVAGAAAWCTLGVAALDASAPPVRVIGLLPPFWLLVTLLALGATATILIRRIPPAPLLLTGILIVPWTGSALEPVLLWQGPLSVLLWLWVALAVVKFPSRSVSTPDSPLAVALVGCAVITLMHVVGEPRRVTGDEPHYLVVAGSVIEDGDLDLTNDYDEARHQSFYAGSLEPRHTVLTPAGKQYSFHGQGLPLLVLPGFFVGGVIGARVTVAAITIAGVTLLWIALRQATQSPGAAWAAIAGVCLQIPFAAQAAALYPEAPAAAITSLGLWLLIKIEDRDAPPAWMLILVGFALATLPWLHIRFVPIAFIVAVSLGAALWRDRDRGQQMAALFALPMISAAVWFASFVVLFETFDPTAPFREKAGGSIAGLPVGSLGLLTDHEYGLLPYAPALVFAAGGIVRARRQRPTTTWTLLAILVSTFAIAASYVWYGGTSSPARFLVAVLPVAGFFVALWWTAAGATWRSLYVVCVALGAVLLGFGSFADRGVRLSGDPDGKLTVFEWLNTVVDIPAGLPSLFRPDTTLSHETAIAGGWVLAGIAVLAIIALVPQSARRRVGSRNAVSACAVIAGMSVALTLSWILRNVEPLTADRSQAALLRAAHASPWREIGLARGGRRVSPAEIVRSVAFAAPGPGTMPLQMAEVPPGRYRIEVSGITNDVDDDTLTLEAGRDAWPIWRWRARSTGDEPTFTLLMPVHSLRVMSAVRAEALRVRLRVLDRAPAASLPDVVATRVTRYGRFLVYSLDQWSFMETGGFWTAGDRTTHIVVADIDGATPSYALQLEAGPRAVVVRIYGASPEQQVALAAGQRMRLLVPAAAEAAPLAITVSGGFDAAAAFSNRADRRWLGVWVSVEAGAVD